MDEAACRGKFEGRRSNPFFPQVRGGRYDANLTDKAKKLCDGCPVRASCLAFAKRNLAVTGVWGGHLFIVRKYAGEASGRRRALRL